MNDYPPFLTKYFNWENDRQYFCSGSLKFGNTAEYRTAEDKQDLEVRGDNHEGISIRHAPLTCFRLSVAANHKHCLICTHH